MKLGMKVILPKGLLFDPRKVERVIENTLNQSALAVKADLGVTTQTWSAKSKPSFKIDSRVGMRIIYTDSLIYKWVDEGTRAHIITAKNGLLRFRTGYKSKTRAGVIGSTGGGASGNWRSKRTVKHPGTKARGFTIVIKKKWDDLLPQQMQRAIDSTI